MSKSHLSKTKIKSDRERIFYHDLINHTHGLLLYISHKKNSKSVSPNELESIENEIKLIQELLKTYFDSENVSNTNDLNFVSLKQLVSEISFLVDTFLKSRLKVSVKNLIEENTIEQDYFLEGRAHLFRILTNHFKNIAESSRSLVEIEIAFDGVCFVLTTKNDILDKNNRSHVGHGLGLISMEELTKHLGANLEYSNDGTTWICSFKFYFTCSVGSRSRAA